MDGSPSSLLSDGNGLTLRALEPEDIAWLYPWENDTSLWQYGSTATPFSRYTLKRYIERACESTFIEMGQLRLMVISDGTPVGAMDIFDYDPVNRRAALGVLITGEHRGKGLGSSGLGLLCRYAADRLLLHQVYAEVAVDNLPGLRLFERNGFIRTATLTDWLQTKNGHTDVAVYQKTLE